MSRNYGLDVLKMLSCFAVVILHVAGRRNGVFDLVIYYLSGYAVPIFFMVNGYLLLNRNTISYNYIIKKIYTILIIIFSWNILLFLAKFIVKGELNNFFFDSIGNLIQKGYFYQFWFFGALIIIYIILPILHKKFLNNKFAVKLVILTITISLIIDILSIIRACMGLSIIQTNVIQTFRIWTWFSYFILGGFIGKNNVWNIIINKISLKFNVLLFIFSSIIVIIYQLFMGSCIYGVKYAEYFYDNIFTFSWAFLLFVLVNRLSWRKNKLLDFISSNIIGIYIVHITVIRFLIKIYHFDTIILITLVIGLSILVSYIISKVPIMKKIIQI